MVISKAWTELNGTGCMGSNAVGAVRIQVLDENNLRFLQLLKDFQVHRDKYLDE